MKRLRSCTLGWCQLSRYGQAAYGDDHKISAFPNRKRQALKYPHFPIGKGKPYEGIENLRPESKETVETFMSWHPKK